jgi:metal-dependent hydrolase (beta-lactamase superfamily II)
MAAAGLELDDVSEVVLTHAQGDHMDGLVHGARVLIREEELEFLASPMARVMRRVLRQPLPPGFAPSRSRSTTARSARLREAAPSAATDESSPSTLRGTPPATSQ